MSDLRNSLIVAEFWLTKLCDEFDIDPDETTANINAVGPDGTRRLASINLSDALEKMRAVIAESPHD